MIKAYGENLLVRRKEVTEEENSIIVTDQDKPAEGKILSVGKLVSNKLTEGMVILFGQYAGVEVEEEDEVLLFIKEKEVLGIREEN